MKQTFIVLIFQVLLATPLILDAQTSPRNTLQLAVGYPHAADKSVIKNCPMVSLMYERKIWKLAFGPIISVGEFDGYEQQRILNVYNTTPQTGTLSIVGLRLNYYFLEHERFDLYGGIMGSYLSASHDVYTETEYVNNQFRTGSMGRNLASEANGFKFGFQAGGHLWFKPRFGLWIEAGYGIARFNAGIALRR